MYSVHKVREGSSLIELLLEQHGGNDGHPLAPTSLSHQALQVLETTSFIYFMKKGAKPGIQSQPPTPRIISY